MSDTILPLLMEIAFILVSVGMMLKSKMEFAGYALVFAVWWGQQSD